MPSSRPLLARMDALTEQWAEASDARVFFLRCYTLMTRRTLAAIARGDFEDPVWVEALLHRFADYYFVALDAYDRESASAPAVWQLAHDTCYCPGVLPVQHLLLGVNAHINYDLVLALVDQLAPEWPTLSAADRARRRADHDRINDVIRATVDIVQDEVVEPAMPSLAFIDRLLGSLDEALAARLLAVWRAAVWDRAIRLLDAADEASHHRLLGEVEQRSLRIGHRFC